MTQEITVQRKLTAALNNYKMFGLWQTFKDALVYFLQQRGDDFDRRYGVDTEATVEPKDAEIGDQIALANAIKYVPTPERVMQHILSSTLQGLDPSKFSFIDLGCGRGRTLIIASRHPFARVLGVEVSPVHAGLAQDNVKRYLAHEKSRAAKCRDIEVVCQNAAEFELPSTDLLIYMYRPFLGPVFEAVADRLANFAKTTGRRVLVAFACPDEDYMFARRPDFQKVRDYWVISIEYSWTLWEVARGN